ncbi:hypothetical protein ABT144_21345 [Streptomyces sp. NPDC002039]|uniref:hypothetical protein n=1 Tax=Streptomyces sp. NPDC002039 TaxID=3154660 RepID=UPI00332E66A5
MTGGKLTLGAVPARLEEREREITAQAETMRERVAQLTAEAIRERWLHRVSTIVCRDGDGRILVHRPPG